ncbi:MAG TPA: methyltransferase domain-containing protein [Candidatus Binatia bacterium]|nr:methyltransferase domain-containing protein [Candidatus Binatia bacterium]
MTEWDAGAYRRQSSLQEAMAEDELAHLRLAGDERVLDVGCGDGRISGEIADRVPRGAVVGIDPSHHMIDFARSNVAPRANLRFEVADVRALPFRAEFDLVVSFNALHWVPEQANALRAMRAALRPGGGAWLRFVPASERRSLEDVIEDVRRSPRWSARFATFRTPFVHPEAGAYRALAASCGFDVVREDVRHVAWDFGSRAGFVAFCRATFVEWTQHLPDAAWDDFIGDVLDRYAAIAPGDPAADRTFRFDQLEVHLSAADAPVGRAG